ncbi:ATP-binding cassette domain-containing protein [Sphaerisporangium corydalis]|uniref:ATP-binding cassette domain-containing protein n=1 Tax=Sphaerisporangium corydalis TaxID=1441875 RepID=A0ABV9ENL3_9ACTN|nr:ATP-binding cassette domain-containing protein [Sphaerisporangium corydalis]
MSRGLLAGTGRRYPPLQWVPAIAVAALTLLPAGYVAAGVLAGGDAARLLWRPRVGELLTNTALLVALGTVACAGVGTLAAWLVERTTLPGRPIWTALMVAPLAVPAFVNSFGWYSLSPSFAGLGAAVLVTTLSYFPLVYLPVAATLRGIDPALEEQSRILGDDAWRTFGRVVLPQARPAISGGALLVACTCWPSSAPCRPCASTRSPPRSTTSTSPPSTEPRPRPSPAWSSWPACWSSVATTTLAFPVAWLSVRRPGRLSRVVERSTYLGNSLPGIVVALALITLTVRHLPSLYQTTAMLIAVYAVLFMPRAMVSLRAALRQTPPELDDVARSLGVGPLAVTLRVTLPLIGRGAAAGAALVFLAVATELTSTLLLAPIGTRTLATLIGRSGCGKSTFLRIVAGLDRPGAGTVAVAGRTLTSPEAMVAPQRRRIGYVTQEGNLFPHLTVAANVTFGLPRRLRRDERVIAELLELVALDRRYGRRYPHELSGGEQQRVALARALAPRPDLVLLDEPFSALDAELRAGTRRAVTAALAATRTTTVLVTHDQAEALSLAGQVAVLRDGVIAQAGPPVEIYRHPADRDVAAFVGELTEIPALLDGGTAETALGRVDLTRPAHGPGAVFVRPEQIVITDPTPGHARATALDVDFRGHDGLVRLRIDTHDGLTVTARCAGRSLPSPGQTVGLHLTGTAVAHTT